MAMRKQRTLTDQLKTAISSSDKSMGQIARESAVDLATISRFMHGKGGLSLAGLNSIADSLGLELRTVSKPESKSRTRKGR